MKIIIDVMLSFYNTFSFWFLCKFVYCFVFVSDLIQTRRWTESVFHQLWNSRARVGDSCYLYVHDKPGLFMCFAILKKRKNNSICKIIAFFLPSLFFCFFFSFFLVCLFVCFSFFLFSFFSLSFFLFSSFLLLFTLFLSSFLLSYSLTFFFLLSFIINSFFEPL